MNLLRRYFFKKKSSLEKDSGTTVEYRRYVAAQTRKLPKIMKASASTSKPKHNPHWIKNPHFVDKNADEVRKTKSKDITENNSTSPTRRKKNKIAIAQSWKINTAEGKIATFRIPDGKQATYKLGFDLSNKVLRVQIMNLVNKKDIEMNMDFTGKNMFIFRKNSRSSSVTKLIGKGPRGEFAKTEVRVYSKDGKLLFKF